LVSVKTAVLKSAVDGMKKCGRGTQKKSYPIKSQKFNEIIEN
jgi:hypothetical protein